MPRETLLFLLLTAVGSISAIAAERGPVFASGERQTPLLELYTSEGCSSCPPADRWLSGLADDARLWTDFVPVAFHVDYWDYIGWKDRFARPAYSARQRELAAEGGARTVYTPGVFVDGNAWLGWHGSRFDGIGRNRVGQLTVSVDGRDVTVEFDAAVGKISEPVVHVALLGMDLSSEVKAGENRGRKLHHDFVVLGLSSAQLTRATDGFSGVTRLPAASEASDHYALAAWVSANGVAASIQAVGGYLPSAP